MFAELFFDRIDGLVEPDLFLGIFIQFDLVVAGDQFCEPDAYEADEQTAIIEFLEDLVRGLNEKVVGVGIVDRFLADYGIEIGIAQFHGETAGELILAAEFEADGFGHADEFCA